MTTLYIRLPARADGDGVPSQFALVADGGAVLQQGSDALRSMGELVSGCRRVVLMLAAVDVTLLNLKVPPLSPARLKAALPTLVEDQILGDPLDCVLVAGLAHGDDGMRTIAVAQRGWLEPLVKAVLALGARSIAALPSQLCLPLTAGSASAAIGAQDITLRQSQDQGLGLGLAAPPALALQTVRALAGDTPLTLYVAADQLETFRAAAGGQGAPVTIEADHWAHWIAGSRSATLDLLPGLGAAGTQPRDWQRWRWPLRIALVALLVNLVALNVAWLRQKREADGVRQAMLQVFKSAYPQEKVILDPAAQMRQNIARAKAASGQIGSTEFTYLAAAFGEATAALARKPGLVSMEYRDHALAVKFKPETVDQNAIEQVKAAITARGLGFDEPADSTWRIDSKGAKK